MKDCAEVLRLPGGRDSRFEGLDLTDPAIDYVGMARSLGVAARRVTEPDALAEAVESSLRGDVPQVIEVPVAR